MLCIQFGCQPQKTDVVRLLGFFVPFFHSAILIDAKRQKRRVDGIPHLNDQLLMGDSAVFQSQGLLFFYFKKHL